MNELHFMLSVYMSLQLIQIVVILDGHISMHIILHKESVSRDLVHSWSIHVLMDSELHSRMDFEYPKTTSIYWCV